MTEKVETQDRAVTMEELGSIFEEKNKPILAALSDWEKKFTAKPETEKPSENTTALAKKDEKAELSDVKSATKDIVPIVGGMFGGVLATELVDGLVVRFMSKSTPKTQTYVAGGVKIVGAYGIWEFGKKKGHKIPYIGKLGMDILALLVLFDGVRNLIPLDTWAQNLANKVTGTTTTAGLAGGNGNMGLGRVNGKTNRNPNPSAKPASGVETFYNSIAGRVG